MQKTGVSTTRIPFFSLFLAGIVALVLAAGHRQPQRRIAITQPISRHGGGKRLD
jgi:hypothetical protein